LKTGAFLDALVFLLLFFLVDDGLSLLLLLCLRLDFTGLVFFFDLLE